MARRIGYLSVGTPDQLVRAGCEYVVSDRHNFPGSSGWKRCLTMLQSGDTLVMRDTGQVTDSGSEYEVIVADLAARGVKVLILSQPQDVLPSL